MHTMPETRRQIVVCAAILLPHANTVLTGPRHYDSTMHSQLDAIFPPRDILARRECLKSAIQGFVDQFGTFLTRTEAYNIVQENGQPFDAERNRSTTELFSEGLY